MKVAIYKADWFDVIAGASVIKYKAGVAQALTDETRMHISQGHAEEVDVPDLPKAQAAAKKATEAAERAAAKAKEAQDALAIAEEAKRIADEAQAEADAEAEAEAVLERQRKEAEEADARIRAQNPEPNLYQPPGAPVQSAPTRADLDEALADLPGAQKDPDYVVGAMRSFFGDLFTADDEARVREAVKAPPPAGSQTA